MPAPIILATWSFGQTATRAGWPVLCDESKSPLDAVEIATRAVEADPDCMTVGAGSYPDRSGRVTLDASIMISPARCGSVGCVARHPHPITIARRVMECTPHIMLVGEAADRFADEQGLAEGELTTETSVAAYEKWRAAHPEEAVTSKGRFKPRANIEERDAAIDDEQLPHNRHHDTVGVLAIDERGEMAGACSTSGYAFKAPGRVGDSPIIGQGLYVLPGVGAAVATGAGERVMGLCSTFFAVERVRSGASPRQAADDAIKRVVETYDLVQEDQVGIIVLNADGAWASAAVRRGFSVAVKSATIDDLQPCEHFKIEHPH